MRKIRIEGYLEYDEEVMHSGDKDKEAKSWFFDVLASEEFLLVDNNDIGDTIGTITIIDFTEDD